MSLTDKITTLANNKQDFSPKLLANDNTHNLLNQRLNLGETKLDGKRYEHNYQAGEGETGPTWERLHLRLKEMGYQHIKPKDGYKGLALYSKDKDGYKSVTLRFADNEAGNAHDADKHPETVEVKHAVYCRNKQEKIDGKET